MCFGGTESRKGSVNQQHATRSRCLTMGGSSAPLVSQRAMSPAILLRNRPNGGEPGVTANRATLANARSTHGDSTHPKARAKDSEECYFANATEKSFATGNNLKKFIITGAPGAGKTAIIRHLELDGFGVVEEAATDVIAAAHARNAIEPWRDPAFIDTIARLQREREIRSSYLPDDIQFHDRSVVCTAALAVYLGHAQSPFLTSELERITKERVYEQRVFFIRNLGYITSTAARRLTFEESLQFEKVHEDTYRRFGFEIIDIEPGLVIERVHSIRAAIKRDKKHSGTTGLS